MSKLEEKNEDEKSESDEAKKNNYVFKGTHCTYAMDSNVYNYSNAKWGT